MTQTLEICITSRNAWCDKNRYCLFFCRHALYSLVCSDSGNEYCEGYEAVVGVGTAHYNVLCRTVSCRHTNPL